MWSFVREDHPGDGVVAVSDLRLRLVTALAMRRLSQTTERGTEFCLVAHICGPQVQITDTHEHLERVIQTKRTYMRLNRLDVGSPA